MKASTFDKKFDRGEDITRHLDLSKARRPRHNSERPHKPVDEAEVKPEFAEEAMRDLKAYRKTGEAADWTGVKRKLGV